MFESLFSRMKPEKEIRLRHVLYVGTLVEKQAEAFYRQLAQRALNDDAKELCHRLADDEAQHFRLIDNILSGWQALPVSDKNLEAIDAGSRLRGLFLSPPEPDASMEEILKYAMNGEQKMVAFYASFDREFDDQWKKMKLWDMIEEEKSHVKKLSDMLFVMQKRKQIAE